MALPFLAGLAIATGVSILASYVGKKAGEYFANKEGVHEIKTNENVKKAISEAKQEVRQNSPGIDIPFIGTPGKKDITIYDIPGAQILYNKQITNKIKKKLGSQYKKAKQVTDAFSKINIGSGIGESVGSLSLSGTSERLGGKVASVLLRRAARTEAKNIAKKTTGKILSKIAGKSIKRIASSRTATAMTSSAVGGLYEGATQTIVSGIAREQKITPSSIIYGALLGGTSAAIGGAIIHKSYMRAAKNPKFKPIAKAIDWGGQTLVDPYEKPGDIIAAMSERIGRKAARNTNKIKISKSLSLSLSPTSTTSNTPVNSKNKIKPRTMSITPTTDQDVNFFSDWTVNSATPSSTPTSTSTTSNTPTNTPSNVPTFSVTTSNTPTSDNTPSNTPSDSNTPSNTPTSDNTPSNTPSDSNTPSNTPTSDNTPSNTPSDSNTPADTPTDTPVPVSTNTPTPQPRMMPPLPLVPGRMSEAPIIQLRGRKTKYINEIELMRRTFKDLYYF